MAMSVTGVVLTVAGFAIPGRVVLEEINSTARKQVRVVYRSTAGLLHKADLSLLQRKKFLVSAEVTELEQSHHQLWVLLIVSAADIDVDVFQNELTHCGVWLVRAVQSREHQSAVWCGRCDSMFFDENGGLIEQSVRLAISIGTYLVPNWGALYVFYVLPRFQFSTVLDVPGLVMDDESEESLYELLPADEQAKPSSGRGRRFY
ncbi:unnamed protein product [Phytophthora fragariaefolia]|uniref:Unnamed protein product n=1 Tax=Phytophthora fragariaefolia TaxID=1490495 RepID=A0A9W6U126_9STRA|nr:unnamed protein product [Phytophthora fragariaefolia]